MRYLFLQQWDIPHCVVGDDGSGDSRTLTDNGACHIVSGIVPNPKEIRKKGLKKPNFTSPLPNRHAIFTFFFSVSKYFFSLKLFKNKSLTKKVKKIWV
jgi:hypothetical protein